MIPSSGCPPWPPDIRPIPPEITSASRSYTTLRDTIEKRTDTYLLVIDRAQKNVLKAPEIGAVE